MEELKAKLCAPCSCSNLATANGYSTSTLRKATWEPAWRMVVPRVQMPACTCHHGASEGSASKSTRGFSSLGCGGNGLRVTATNLATLLSASAWRRTDWPTRPLAPTSNRSVIRLLLAAIIGHGEFPPAGETLSPKSINVQRTLGAPHLGGFFARCGYPTVRY